MNQLVQTVREVCLLAKLMGASQSKGKGAEERLRE